MTIRDHPFKEFVTMLGLEFYRELNGDYLVIDLDSKDYYRYIYPGLHYEGRAAAIAGLPTSVCTTGISATFLADCQEVAREEVPEEWMTAFNILDNL